MSPMRQFHEFRQCAADQGDNIAGKRDGGFGRQNLVRPTSSESGRQAFHIFKPRITANYRELPRIGA
jgi:hypothetical protein